jgi:hypothetical protein
MQLFVSVAVTTMAQSISGIVTNCNGGRPLIGVTVRITDVGTGNTTDANSKYQINDVEAGLHTLEFSFIGLQPVRKEIKVEANLHKTLNVCMNENATSFNEVIVEARNERKDLMAAKMQGIPVSVIDGKTLAGRGTSIAEVINHQTGVKIRRTGAVGSETKVNVRGLEGNRVQIYMDGKPLNTPDGSFNINDIPLQYIDRVEIYKGIVLPEFGGDGLSSAVNVVTIDAEEAFYDISYSIGSYGAHEGSILYKHYFQKAKIMASAMYGFGYAANDYSMKLPYVEGLTIKRDHDRFRKHLGAVIFDFRDTYFDECEVEIPFYVNDRQIPGIQTNKHPTRSIIRLYGCCQSQTGQRAFFDPKT